VVEFGGTLERFWGQVLFLAFPQPWQRQVNDKRQDLALDRVSGVGGGDGGAIQNSHLSEDDCNEWIINADQNQSFQILQTIDLQVRL